MKYSFFSSVCAWLPSALMMAVSASGASSAPLASFVKYVPEKVGKKTNLDQGNTNARQPCTVFVALGERHI